MMMKPPELLQKRFRTDFSQPMLTQQISGLNCRTCSQEEAVNTTGWFFFEHGISKWFAERTLGTPKREFFSLWVPHYLHGQTNIS